MRAYLARRLVSGAAVIAGLIVFTFLATHFIGDPVLLLVDKEFSSPEDRQQLMDAGGFTRPVWQQFADFAGGALRGDFGRSIWQNRPASDVVLERLPATALLAGAAIVFTWAIAIPAAVIAARNAGRWPDTVITALATAAASTASFWWALVLILVFAVGLGWLPTSGYGSWRHLILPVLALTPLTIGRITQVLQTSVAAELRQMYVSTARAKGLRERSIVRRHVLRNSAIVGVTLFGGELIALLNGAVIVESIFAWPGVGQVALQAIQRRDLPVLMASVFYVGVLVTVVNLLVDCAYAYLDPRVRLR
jgi:peptide/nickel transport system permease protein